MNLPPAFSWGCRQGWLLGKDPSKPNPATEHPHRDFWHPGSPDNNCESKSKNKIKSQDTFSFSKLHSSVEKEKKGGKKDRRKITNVILKMSL